VAKDVLIVEDDRGLAGMIARAVEREGYPVRVVYDGQAALENIEQSPPGLVLLDLLLPRKDGRAVLEALRSSEKTRELPVIVTSGVLRSPAQGREIEQAGADAFIPKPMARSNLVRVIRNLLGPPPDSDATDGQDKLSLASTPVPELLWGAMQRGVTGTFNFQTGRKRKMLLLEKGKPTRIRSNIIKECLGQRLLSAGRISKVALDESLRRAKEGEGRQGEVLVKMGAVTADEVDEALRLQGEEKFFELFSWSEGSVCFDGTTKTLDVATPLQNITGEEAILRGVEQMNPDALERGLAPLKGQPVAIDTSSVPRGIRRRPEVETLQKALSDAGGRVEPVLGLHGSVLYALQVMGALTLGTQGEAPTSARARASKAEAKPSKPAASLANLDELQETLSAHSTQTHFEVLGVKENAPTSEIKAAFFRLAKRFHPDRYGGEPDEVRISAGEVFARISVAHEVLTDPDQRNEYIETLNQESEEGSPREVSQILTAEVQFQKGEALLKKKDYKRALEQFKWAIELNGEEGEFRALYGWTMYLCNPKDAGAQSSAREELEKAVELAPNSVSGYYYLGRLLKACGEMDSAVKMFKQAIEIDPAHVEANQELRVFRMRKERGSGSDRKGMFGFGRKKS
jgi:CheY-like chemotaxis protein